MPGLHLQVGRQDFDEPREWIFDEVLDGIRAYLQKDPFQLELSASKGRTLLDVGNETEDIHNFMVVGMYEAEKDWLLSAYLIDRRDQENSKDFSPFHYGLRSYGWPNSGLRHWVELARADGVDGFERLQGTGVDVGLSYVEKEYPKSCFTVGYALGTGDPDPADDQGGFRQTGLQDNNGKFGGVTSFRYYGELLDPELANLSVLTLAVGFRPLREFSVDLVGHKYRQDEAANKLIGSDLKASPNGQSKDLGEGLDLILGYRGGDRISSELTLATFRPGGAFTPGDAAYRLKFEVRFKF